MTASWNAALHARLAGVLEAVPLPSTELDAAALPDAAPLPIWIRLTLALHAAWGGASATPDDDALLDLVWGQYALFLWIRLQDDLLDEHYRDLRLQFLADRLLLDGLAALERVPGLGPVFRTECRARLQETTGAILEVERLQSQPGAFNAAHLPLHARVSALFRIGPAAVCYRLKHAADRAWVAELQTRAAISSQIVDDLEDLQADLDQDRYTFVANVLAGTMPGESPSNSDMVARVAGGLLLPSRGRDIWDALTAAAAGAAAALPAHAPPFARDLSASLARAPTVLAQQLHEARVRALFGAGAPFPTA